MRRPSAIAGSIVFLIIAPCVVAGYVPWLLCHWQMSPPWHGFRPIRWFGVLLVLAGVPVLLDSFARFALQGIGTPAPVAPTEHLVVTGLYRYVRNPMYVAVLLVIIGQGFFFANIRVLEYAVLVWIAFFLFVIFYEEPTLRNSFGSSYEDFHANVPRWIPRLRRWHPASDRHSVH